MGLVLGLNIKYIANPQNIQLQIISIQPLEIFPEYICPIPGKKYDKLTASQGSLLEIY